MFTEDEKDVASKRKFTGDRVNHPLHYNQGQIEVIEFIEDQNFCYHLGSALKYICRAGCKIESPEVEDLEKAIWYIRRRIALIRSTREGTVLPRPNEMPQDRVP